ncbi:MAG TPA: enoyl-CoA hydratase/isomerase family protein [Nonomuraea sp.]|uniref:enoyl-CoA hydratase/isomerase family protein n=1 Tax=Nonomuraea sp. NPDC049649 TaxID=3155776 RepID=UPI002CA483AF|nr:enoyl-CoA hydratase/isomerase family protein [Nonomuraea sp.]
MAPPVVIEDDGSVATLVLNRPERHNSLVPELLTALLEALADVSQARAVVLAAAGRSFSTGGDVRAFAERDGDELRDYADELVGLLHETMLALMRLPAPVVAAVQGTVTGGSLGLLLASDLVLMHPAATVAPWYTTVGFTPDGGWTALLPERIGTARAAAVQFTNTAIDAPTALAWGLATGIDPDVRRAAQDTARTVAGQRRSATRETKRLLRGDLDAVAARLDAERAAFVRQITTPEAREGMTAFLAASRAMGSTRERM